MKKKNLFLSALLAGAMFMGNAQVAQAQFHFANKHDDVAKSSAVGVTNTGNDMIVVNGSLFRVMVWDGTGTMTNAPGYAVNYNGATYNLGLIGGGASGISDPDVVAFQFGTNVRLLITYIQNGAVRYEVVLFNPATMVPQQVQARTFVSAVGSYPNVDKDVNGQAVIVYEKNTGIYARTLDLNSPSVNLLTLEHRVDDALVTGYSRFHPDVTVKQNAAGTNSVVTFIYENLDQSSSATDIMITQESLSAVRNTSQSSSAASQTVYWPLYNWEKPQYPRIAAQKTTHNNDNDFVAVFQEDNTKIKSVGTWNNSQSHDSFTINDGTSGNDDITNSENSRPAVTFSGDFAIAAWAFHDQQAELGSKDWDILAARLQWNGNPIGDGYSVVNFDIRGDQVAPSVSGLFSPSEVFYTFYDGAKQQLLYKNSLYLNQNLRTSGPNQSTPATSLLVEDKLAVYPNPITENSQIVITLTEGNEVMSLDVYNLTGKKVATLEAKNLKAGKNQLSFRSEQIDKLPQGMYILRLVTNRSQHTFKIKK